MLFLNKIYQANICLKQEKICCYVKNILDKNLNMKMFTKLKSVLIVYYHALLIIDGQSITWEINYYILAISYLDNPNYSKR